MESTWYLCRLFCLFCPSDLLQNDFTVDVKLIVMLQFGFALRSHIPDFVIVIIFWGPSGEACLHAEKWLIWALILKWCSLLPCANPTQARTSCEKGNKWKTQRTDFCRSCTFYWQMSRLLIVECLRCVSFVCVCLSMHVLAGMAVGGVYCDWGAPGQPSFGFALLIFSLAFTALTYTHYLLLCI